MKPLESRDPVPLVSSASACSASASAADPAPSMCMSGCRLHADRSVATVPGPHALVVLLGPAGDQLTSTWCGSCY
eukprot:2227478-Prymnesium_polylepis.1